MAAGKASHIQLGDCRGLDCLQRTAQGHTVAVSCHALVQSVTQKDEYHVQVIPTPRAAFIIPPVEAVISCDSCHENLNPQFADRLVEETPMCTAAAIQGAEPCDVHDTPSTVISLADLSRLTPAPCAVPFSADLMRSQLIASDQDRVVHADQDPCTKSCLRGIDNASQEPCLSPQPDVMSAATACGIIEQQWQEKGMDTSADHVTHASSNMHHRNHHQHLGMHSKGSQEQTGHGNGPQTCRFEGCIDYSSINQEGCEAAKLGLILQWRRLWILQVSLRTWHSLLIDRRHRQHAATIQSTSRLKHSVGMKTGRKRGKLISSACGRPRAP